MFSSGASFGTIGGAATRAVAVGFTVLVLTPFGQPAHAQLACPISSGVPDGCPAPKGGTFQVPTFFSGYARQSGQTWGNKNGDNGCPTSRQNCHPNWNVAGVDYPIGVYTPVAQLADPALIPASSNCVWHATGSHWNPSAPYLQRGVNLTQNSDIEGYNFGDIGGHGCAGIELPVHYAASVTIRNNRFGFDDPGCGANFQWVSGISPSIIYDSYHLKSGNLTITQNEFDGETDNPNTGGAAMVYWIGARMGGTLRMTYNAFYKNPAHAYAFSGIAGAGTVSAAYNYCEQIHDTHGWKGHAEVQGMGGYHEFSSQFETVLNTTDTNGAGETLLYVVDAPSTVYSSLISNDVLVMNTIGGNPAGTTVIGAHLVNGVLTVDSIKSGGAFSAFAPGMTIGGANLFLTANLNNNTGVGGQWAAECGINAGSVWCPFANTSHGVANNTASWPATSSFVAVGSFSGAPENVLTITAVKSGTIAVGDVLWGNGGGKNIVPGTTITGQTYGTPGGVGGYTVSTPQFIVSGLALAVDGSSNVWNGQSDVQGLSITSYFGNFAAVLGWGTFTGPTQFSYNYVDVTGALIGAWAPGVKCTTRTIFKGNVVMTNGATLTGGATRDSVNNWSTPTDAC